MTTQTIDQAGVQAFAGKVFGDVSGMFVTLMASIGDHHGLFKDLAAHSPATSEELAARTGVHERYAREWLAAMAAGGYLTYDPESGRFTLPPEHAVVLAHEGSPIFVGGMYQQSLGALPNLGAVVDAFRTGGGVPQSAYGPEFWAGMERFSGGWYDNLLVPVWIASMPEVQAKLARGAAVADIGCGSGRALIRLAEAFPHSRFTGYDAFPAQIARAAANAAAAGVADRVAFKQLDAAGGLPEQYDVITTFDVLHDAVDPRGLLRAIRRGLKPDGRFLCLEINCSDKLEENAGPMGAAIYGISVFYCMSVSLAAGGEGLGTAGLPEPHLRELCAEAGFSGVRRIPLEDPFNALYEITP